MIKVNNAEKVHNDIRYMLETGVSYIDALVEYSEKNNMEIETLAAIVKSSPILKSKVKEEATKNKLVKKDKDADATICD